MGAETKRGAALASTLAFGLTCLVARAAGAASLPDGRYRAMVDRPLFAPSRRPPPPAPAPLAPLEVPVLPEPAAPRPDVSLSGVIAGGDRGGIALIRRPQDGVPMRLAVGGQIDGWTLAEIRPRAIVLRRDGRDVTVDLPSP